MNNNNFRGSVTLVTGSSKGIGRAIAQRFACEGSKLVINYRTNEEAAAETVAAIEANGGEAFTYQADVSDSDQIEALFSAAEERYGGLDYLVCNAAYGRFEKLSDLPLKVIRKAFDVNVVGVLECARSALPLMKSRGGGRIVVLGSPGAHRVAAGYAAVGVSKGALESLVRYLATSFARHGITVNAVSPGIVQTSALEEYFEPDQIEQLAARTPMGRTVQPDEVAAAVAFLCTPEAGMICGHVLSIDGGLTLPI
ncbi:MAG: SDR family NAD(P)-dependent oxidoreductase [Anaerolineales bacterium]